MSIGPLRVRAQRVPALLSGADRSATNSPGEDLALMFAIGAHVGNAVLRNRVRRRLKALLRERGGPLAGWQLLISAPASVATLPASDLTATIDRLIETVLSKESR